MQVAHDAHFNNQLITAASCGSPCDSTAFLFHLRCCI